LKERVKVLEDHMLVKDRENAQLGNCVLSQEQEIVQLGNRVLAQEQEIVQLGNRVLAKEQEILQMGNYVLAQQQENVQLERENAQLRTMMEELKRKVTNDVWEMKLS
jgi:hypothetical protein